jgi:hypothetical protein
MRVWATQAWPLFMMPASMSCGTTVRDVGVVEHDGGRLAAQLEGARAQQLATQRHRSSCRRRWSR